MNGLARSLTHSLSTCGGVDIPRFIHLGTTRSVKELTQLKSLHEAIDKLEHTDVSESEIIQDRKFLRKPCRSVNDYQLVASNIDEGTFGSVSIGTDPIDGATVALKRLKHLHSSSGIPYWSLREMIFLRRLNHKNIVKSREIAVELSYPDTRFVKGIE